MQSTLRKSIHVERVFGNFFLHIRQEKIKTTENPDGTLAPETPEIKANTADLDLKKDTDIGMSDLKKP